MSDMIPATLIPAGVNDQRSRDFIAALSAVLEEFQTATLLVQDPATVTAAMLPIMTVERGMTEFMTPGLLEAHVRALLTAAPDIHAMTGTIAGARRALGAIGVTVDWTQWWQMEPPGHHDTHDVIAYVNDHLFADQAALLTAETQVAVLRLIRATQRWSQDVSFKIGIGARSSVALASVFQRTAIARLGLNAAVPMPAGRVALAGGLQRAGIRRVSATGSMPQPAAITVVSGNIQSVQIVAISMEARL